MSSDRGARRAFALTWIAYASYYLCRKGVAVSKARLVTELGIAEPALAAIDTAYLVAYAFGQFASGLGVQRFGGRKMIAIGMIGSALCCAAFGASTAAWALVAAFAVNGLFQSTGWPAGTQVMAAWYGRRDRGTAMGLWATCYQVGGFAATALATALLASFGWRSAFFVPAVWVAIWGLVVLLALEERPPSAASEPAVADGDHDRATLRVVLSNPKVWVVGFAHCCLKIVLYGLIFWLPYYLHTAVGYDVATSGYLSVSLEVGGILGTIVSGVLSDRAGGRHRSGVAAIMMLLLGFALVGYGLVDSRSAVVQALCIAGLGFLLFGPESLVAGAAAQDLGGARDASMSVGAVNGIGSLGGIVQGWLTLGLRDAFGWTGVFYGFFVLAVTGALALLVAWKGWRGPLARSSVSPS
ncbi:MAG: MFS transporter [Deltaproteobacteria bacterium]|nr:MFS transporter [Deltaproteobacteria bacterium]